MESCCQDLLFFPPKRHMNKSTGSCVEASIESCHPFNYRQVVAVKQLDRNGLQGNREFLVEVLMLSLLHHPNLVNLIGYCADGDQRLLVYEFMPLGSLEDHLHGMFILHHFTVSLIRIL